MITRIQFGVIPGRVETLDIAPNSTLQDLINTIPNYLERRGCCRVNGASEDPSYIPIENDIILVAFPIRGEVTCRRKGIWRLHKNDADDIFPSPFHAHNVDAPEVIDLQTGNVYNTTNKSLLYCMDKRSLRFLNSCFQRQIDKWRDQ